jgi:hypothetical protein
MWIFGKKHPKVPKPERMEVEFHAYLVRAGEIGGSPYGEPSMSEHGKEQIDNLGTQISARHPDSRVEVLLEKNPASYMPKRQGLTAKILAKVFGAKVQALDPYELAHFDATKPQDSYGCDFLRRLRSSAEPTIVESGESTTKPGTQVFVVVAMEPVIERIFGRRYVNEGSAHHLKIRSTSRYATATVQIDEEILQG